MFGYVKINKMDLTFREYEHYRGYYCGLCKCLKDNHGEISRLSLNYDITFLALILSAIYRPKSNVIEEGCITNPFKKKKKIINEITEYAASMNVLLAYYKLEDNIKDDNRQTYNINKTKIKYIKESIITGNYTYDPDTTYLVFRCYSPKDYHCTFELELSLEKFIDILLSEDNRNKRINFYQI